jgi:hypothetical protein
MPLSPQSDPPRSEKLLRKSSKSTIQKVGLNPNSKEKKKMNLKLLQKPRKLRLLKEKQTNNPTRIRT